jgi:hypothetical protein
MEYMPKGAMCRSCIYKTRNCNNLDFKNMPVITRDSYMTVVLCTEYVQDDDYREAG